MLKNYYDIMLEKILLDFLINTFYILWNCKEKNLQTNKFLRDFNSFI